MARPAALAYRCRHCGAIFHPAHVPDGLIAGLVAIGARDTPREWGPAIQTLEIHRCSDRTHGIADFAGIVFDAIDAIDGPG